MPKDLKTGLIVGLVLAAVATIWMAGRVDLSTQSRTSKLNQQVDTNTPARYVTELPHSVPEQSGADINDTAKHPGTENKRTQRFYIVKEGETLSEISRRYYGTTKRVEDIVRANRIDNPNKIKPGTKLILPE